MVCTPILSCASSGRFMAVFFSRATLSPATSVGEPYTLDRKQSRRFARDAEESRAKLKLSTIDHGRNRPGRGAPSNFCYQVQSGPVSPRDGGSGPQHPAVEKGAQVVLRWRPENQQAYRDEGESNEAS